MSRAHPVERRRPEAGGRLLEVDDLWVEFRTREGVARAVNGVSYAVDPGELLAVLGESGSGKSVTAQAIIGILDSPPAAITKGEIRMKGVDLLQLPEPQMRRYRGAEIAIVFQDALSALNPVATVGAQIAEIFMSHQRVSRRDARRRSIALMEQVRIPSAARRVDNYPHQFSGGMRQRVMIAMALALDPAVLIADEPTTALDVTIQAQILELLSDLRRQRNLAVILITHDLGVVADVADRIAVMYAGRIVESAPVEQIFDRPAHPYTKGLLNSIPRVADRGQRLRAMKGLPPNLTRLPNGCPFSPRCPRAEPICSEQDPPLVAVGAGHAAACHFALDVQHAGR